MGEQQLKQDIMPNKVKALEVSKNRQKQKIVDVSSNHLLQGSSAESGR